MLSTCAKCKETKPVSEFHKDRRRKSGVFSYCKVCKTGIDRDKYQRNRTTVLLKAYGITEDEYNKMYSEQNGDCKICSKNFSRLCVDHDHKSGKVRGLLCHHCNTMLGLALDDISTLTNAINYLKSTGDNRSSG